MYKKGPSLSAYALSFLKISNFSRRITKKPLRKAILARPISKLPSKAMILPRKYPDLAKSRLPVGFSISEFPLSEFQFSVASSPFPALWFGPAAVSVASSQKQLLAATQNRWAARRRSEACRPAPMQHLLMVYPNIKQSSSSAIRFGGNGEPKVPHLSRQK
jgi:hypothetical protein